ARRRRSSAFLGAFEGGDGLVVCERFPSEKPTLDTVSSVSNLTSTPPAKSLTKKATAGEVNFIPQSLENLLGINLNLKGDSSGGNTSDEAPHKAARRRSGDRRQSALDVDDKQGHCERISELLKELEMFCASRLDDDTTAPRHSKGGHVK
ncbi:hypothetical protein SARC_13876, partial [Sphaeroforma arctica JP610]